MINIPNHEYRVSITSSCNMKCIYCHNEGNQHRSELTLDDIKKLLNNSYDLGLESVRLTGGEPLIHNQIFEICRMIHEDYNLKLGINTNGIERKMLDTLCYFGYVDRIVFGLDFFDGRISKQSIVGKSSSEILETITTIHSKYPEVNVSISTVYNGDYENIKKILDFGIQNGIRIKILEVVGDTNDKVHGAYIQMRDKLFNDFKFDEGVDKYNQVQGYIDGKNVVSFFHSHCRANECDLCKELSLRINSDGRIRTCLFDTEETDYRNGNVRENLERILIKS